MTSCELKAFHNRTVSITFEDGEIATARLTCTGEDCADVMVDILGTSRPDHYAQLDTCSYIVPASEIASVVEIALTPAAAEAIPPRESLGESPHPVESPSSQEDSIAESLAA